MPVRSTTRRGELGPFYVAKPIRSIQDFSVSEFQLLSISRLKPPRQPAAECKSSSCPTLLTLPATQLPAQRFYDDYQGTDNDEISEDDPLHFLDGRH